jgi:peptidoglycan-N-acetylglucosamine deacetylase
VGAIVHIPSRVLGTVLGGAVTHVATRERLVALTFDDGPHPESTPQVIELLERHGARGTFFVVGESAHQHRALVRRTAEAGHAIGNHSWDHRSFPTLDSRERRRQLRACEETIAPYSQGLFRPPYGHLDWRSRRDLTQLNYRVVTWSVSGMDWRDDSPSVLYERLAQGLGPGRILLLHDALAAYEDERFCPRDATLEAVRLLMSRHHRDYQFVTVPELLRRGRPVTGWWRQRGDPDYLARLRRPARLNCDAGESG